MRLERVAALLAVADAAHELQRDALISATQSGDMRASVRLASLVALREALKGLKRMESSA